MTTQVINGIVYLLVTNKAKEIFSSGTFDLYLLYQQDTDFVEMQGDIEYAYENGINVGIKVDNLVNIIKQLV